MMRIWIISFSLLRRMPRTAQQFNLIIKWPYNSPLCLFISNSPIIYRAFYSQKYKNHLLVILSNEVQQFRKQRRKRKGAVIWVMKQTILYFIIDRKRREMNQIFFVYFEENIKWKDISISTFYNRPTFAVYLIAWASLATFIYVQLAHSGEHLANVPLQLFYSNQYWRLFTAPLAIHPGLINLVWLASSLWWLLSIFPEHQKKYSTIHLLVQIFLQNILLQVSYCMFIVLFAVTVGVDKFKENEFVSMGWDPLILIWVFLITANIRQQYSRLFFLPFQLKNELLVWILATWTILFSHQKALLIIATLLGSIQFHILKRSLIKAPLVLYKNLEKPFSKCTKYFSSYITIQSTKNSLEHLYPQEFEQVFGKQQYEIRHDKQYEDLLMFESPQIKIPNEIKANEIDKWINEDLSTQIYESEKEIKTGSASIFQISEDNFA